MRKWNTILSLALILIFMIHALMGSFMLVGVSGSAGKVLAWIGCGLVVIHTIFGILLTVKTLQGAKGKWYLKQNALFWTRRFSGIVILAMAFFHIGLFGGMQGDKYILFEFTTMRFITQLLLITALFTHIFVNIRPMLISLGRLKYKERRIDFFLVLAIILLFCTGAVTLYFIMWQLL